MTPSALLAIVVTLAWDPNPEPDIAAYTVKWGFAAGQEDHNVDAGLNTTISIDEPWSVGMEIFFVVTASNISNLESAPSNEVSYTVPHGKPKPPFNLRILDVTR